MLGDISGFHKTPLCTRKCGESMVIRMIIPLELGIPLVLVLLKLFFSFLSSATL